ncbi:MAG: hypothetical protein AB1489_04095 [Acidobacteriota bacterium]
MYRNDNSDKKNDTIIVVKYFQPFESRVGIDTVVGLKFDQNPGVVTALCEALQQCPRRGFTPGGWLPVERLWFVEKAAWPFVRAHLSRLSYKLELSFNPAGD